MKELTQEQKDARIRELHSDALKLWPKIEKIIDELKLLGPHSLDNNNALLNTADWLNQLAGRASLGQELTSQSFPEWVQKAIAFDQQEMQKALAEYPNLAPEECCPHSSADSEYIGDGDTQHTCRCCGYYWITSNPRHYE